MTPSCRAGTKSRSVSCAFLSCLCFGIASSVRMLCSRSASFTNATRHSADMASSSARWLSSSWSLPVGDTLDDGGDMCTERRDAVVERLLRVLDHVVQQRADDRRRST